MGVRRFYFSLIELLIVLAVIASITGVISVHLINSIREQHFKDEVETVANKLRLAQDLMLIFHANMIVEVTINEKNDGFDLTLIPEVAIPSPWLNEISKPHKLLYIHHINFTGLERETNKLQLKFLSGGSEMSRGILRLSTSETDQAGALTRYMLLPGYPTPLTILESAPEKRETSLEEIQNRELTLKTIEGIRARSL